MDSLNMFAEKARYYSKYRPSYPDAFMSYLLDEAGMAAGSIVADIGAGTGILTKLLAGRFRHVYAVEPDSGMRESCKIYCRGIGNCHIAGGRAEKTSLPDDSVDMITAAQSFHWFDRERSKKEFQRILRPDGLLVIVYNRKAKDTPMSVEHVRLLEKYCPDFRGYAGGADYSSDAFADVFAGGCCEHRIFENGIHYTPDGFVGAALSASYAPSEKDSSYGALVEGLIELFYKYSENGTVAVKNDTHSYVGRIHRSYQ